MHSYQITQKKPHTILLALLNSFQQGHIGNTKNIGNIWTTIKSKIQKHTKSKQKHYGPTTRTNQQAYCQLINMDIDRESKLFFTYRERRRKKILGFSMTAKQKLKKIKLGFSVMNSEVKSRD